MKYIPFTRIDDTRIIITFLKTPALCLKVFIPHSNFHNIGKCCYAVKWQIMIHVVHVLFNSKRIVTIRNVST